MVISFTSLLLVNDHVINLRLYPNPFKDYVMLHADAEKYLIKIIDLHGKNILSNSVDASGADVKLPLTHLADGVYYFQ
jgi:hypothetical protein